MSTHHNLSHTISTVLCATLCAGVNDSSGKRIAEGRTSDNAKSEAINFFVEPGGEYVLQIHYYVDGVVTYTTDVIVTAALCSYI